MTIFAKSIASLLMVAMATAPLRAADVAPAPGTAAPPVENERLILARQFLSITYSEDTFFKMVKEGSMAVAETFSEAAETDSKRVNQEIERYLAVAEPVIRKHASLIREANALAMARAYNVAELRELVAFASTPTGEKYLTTIDGTEADPAVMDAYVRMQEELQPLFRDMKKAECAAAARQRLAMGDKSARCPLADDNAEASGRD